MGGSADVDYIGESNLAATICAASGFVGLEVSPASNCASTPVAEESARVCANDGGDTGGSGYG
jgi:hypothetical protein